MHIHNVAECGEQNYHWTLMVSLYQYDKAVQEVKKRLKLKIIPSVRRHVNVIQTLAF